MLASLRGRTTRTAALGRCVAGRPHALGVRPAALRTMSAAAATAPSQPQPPRSGSKAARPASSVPVAANAAAAAASRARSPLGPGQTELDVEGAARPTTVLLIGWLGCSSKNLEQYKKMHERAGRHVISYQPSALSFLFPQTISRPGALHQIHELLQSCGAGHALVLHAMSNLGAFHLAFFMRQLHLDRSDLGERQRNTILAHTRGVVFDSAPSPLDNATMARGYMGYIDSWRPNFWKRMRARMHRSAPEQQHYERPLLTPLLQLFCRALNLLPSFESNLRALHVSLHSLLPASAHLLYLYSDADGLIPSSAVEAHAAAQAHLPLSLRRAPVRLAAEPLSAVEAVEKRREQSEFEATLTSMPLAMQKEQRQTRRQRLFRKAELQFLSLPVASVPIHVAQPVTTTADAPLVLLEQFRAQLSHLARACLPPHPTWRYSDGVDVVTGTVPRERALALLAASEPEPAANTETESDESRSDQSDPESEFESEPEPVPSVALLRTITLAHFHASGHVQHYRKYPLTYSSLLDEWCNALCGARMQRIKTTDAEAVSEVLAAQATVAQERMAAAAAAKAANAQPQREQ